MLLLGMLLFGALMLAGCAAAPTKPTCSTAATSTATPGSMGRMLEELKTSECEMQQAEYRRLENRSFVEKLKDGDRDSWLKVGGVAIAALIIAALIQHNSPAERAKRDNAAIERRERMRAAAAERAEAEAAQRALDEERQRWIDDAAATMRAGMPVTEPVPAGVDGDQARSAARTLVATEQLRTNFARTFPILRNPVDFASTLEIAGLAGIVVQTVPTPAGNQELTTVRVPPLLRVGYTAGALILDFDGLPGQTLGVWRRSAEVLRSGLRASSITVDEPIGGRFRVTLTGEETR
ncbi:hypothetical protein AXK58_14320 [Tsukamurella tyrosinosolvens]|nr:hypothetical protein AXK58_14320 [Tsukamurella tyrosinosolvens]